VVPGLDGRKMSKSYGNTIELFATKDEIVKSVMAIVTDSSGERPKNVYAIHRLLKSEAELASLYEAHQGKYKALKDALVEDLEAFIAPLRERRATIASDESSVREVLEEGGKRAHAQAEKKMGDVRKKIGVR
jgi:tryptophanyl-tRNA synthetase